MRTFILFLVLAGFLAAESCYSQYRHTNNNVINNSCLNVKEERFDNISLGIGLYSEGFDKEKYGTDVSFGLRHQYTEHFYLEAAFDYAGINDGNKKRYLIGLIPQWCIAGSEKLKFVTGPGLQFIAVPKEGAIILPFALAKLEYQLYDNLSISPEIKIPPLIASVKLSYRVRIRN